MGNKSKAGIVFVSIMLMSLIVFWVVSQKNLDRVETIIATMSIIVTLVLGIVTFIQTSIQIKLDKIDKTPYYKLYFKDLNDKLDNPIENAYYRNCLNIKRFGDTGFIELEFKNATNNSVGYVEVEILDKDENYIDCSNVSFANKKSHEIHDQEKSIEAYAKFLKEANEEEIGDGLAIFEKWNEIDTKKNTNYEIRVRELILHFYYYYNCSEEDRTKYRAVETTNEERDNILKRVINKGTKQKITFYEYYKSNLKGVISQLQPEILERNENKDKYKEIEKLEKLEEQDIKVNQIANCEQFKYYIPYDIYKELITKYTDSLVELKIKININSVYGYEYIQIIKLKLIKNAAVDICSLPDEIDISEKIKQYNEKWYDDSEENKQHDLKTINQLKGQRGRIYIDDISYECKENKTWLN